MQKTITKKIVALALAVLMLVASFSVLSADRIFITTPATSTKINLNVTKRALLVNETLELTATLSSGSSNMAITWTSSDEDVVTVEPNATNDKKAVIKGISQGTATITAKGPDNDSPSAVCTVTVVNFVLHCEIGSTKADITNADHVIGFNQASSTQRIYFTVAGYDVTNLTCKLSDAAKNKGITTRTRNGKIELAIPPSFYGEVGGIRIHAKSDEGNGYTFNLSTKAQLRGSISITGTTYYNYYNVGTTLTAKTTGITSPTAADRGTLYYQWKRNGTAINGATNSTYVLTKDDIGKTISVEVTAEKCGGALSAATGYPIAAAGYIPLQQITAYTNTPKLTVGDVGYVWYAVYPSGATDAQSVFWYSSNSYVASVNDAGWVYARNPGKALMTVYAANGVTSSVWVEVVARQVVTPTPKPTLKPTPEPTPEPPIEIPDSDIPVGIKDDPLTLSEFTTLFNSALRNKPSGSSKLTVTVTGKTSVSSSVFTGAANLAKNAGVTLTIYFDQRDSSGIQTRLYVNPANATKGISVTARTDSDRAYSTLNKFNGWFKNTIRTMAFEQQGSLGMSVNVAVRISTSGMDKNNLYFYSYDSASNTYRRISTSYYFDSAGYLHFDTTYGGTIIISSGSLVRR